MRFWVLLGLTACGDNSFDFPAKANLQRDIVSTDLVVDVTAQHGTAVITFAGDTGPGATLEIGDGLTLRIGDTVVLACDQSVAAVGAWGLAADRAGSQVNVATVTVAR